MSHAESDKNVYERAAQVEPAPTVTLHFPPARLPAMITRLTTYLLEHQYGFLQTYHTPEQAEFEVFDAQAQCVVHLTVKGSNATVARSAAQALSVASDLAPEVAHLLQHLLQLEMPGDRRGQI